MLVAIAENVINEMPDNEDCNLIVINFSNAEEQALQKEYCEKRLNVYKKKLSDCIGKRR